MRYEEGMSAGATMNMATKKFKPTGVFRGKKYELAKEYDSEIEARKAAEDYCRSMGWDG